MTTSTKNQFPFSTNRNEYLRNTKIQTLIFNVYAYNMGKIILTLLFALLSVIAVAKEKKEINNPISGTWKYTNQSAKNDFHRTLFINSIKEYNNEYFVFETNNKFRHEFTNTAGIVVKTLNGKWKITGDKIEITYRDIDYSLTVDYFFMDKDLVLGQNFSHVIFTKDNFDSQSLSMK